MADISLLVDDTQVHYCEMNKYMLPRRMEDCNCWPLVCKGCYQYRPDDDRVKAGMKCGLCGY